MSKLTEQVVTIKLRSVSGGIEDYRIIAQMIGDYAIHPAIHRVRGYISLGEEYSVSTPNGMLIGYFKNKAIAIACAGALREIVTAAELFDQVSNPTDTTDDLLDACRHIVMSIQEKNS